MQGSSSSALQDMGGFVCSLCSPDDTGSLFSPFPTHSSEGTGSRREKTKRGFVLGHRSHKMHAFTSAGATPEESRAQPELPRCWQEGHSPPASFGGRLSTPGHVPRMKHLRDSFVAPGVARCEVPWDKTPGGPFWGCCRRAGRGILSCGSFPPSSGRESSNQKPVVYPQRSPPASVGLAFIHPPSPKPKLGAVVDKTGRGIGNRRELFPPMHKTKPQERGQEALLQRAGHELGAHTGPGPPRGAPQAWGSRSSNRRPWSSAGTSRRRRRSRAGCYPLPGQAAPATLSKPSLS